MVVSLALHAVLLVVALSFVAVTVVTKGEKKFESRQVNRPRLPPKKLQVPVKIKKQKRKPKLRQRIVVKTKVRNMPDIKMPEISGIKGGLGAAGAAGLGDAGSVGFSMPEIEVFGVRSKGEKVLLALDTDRLILRDEVGGVPAYMIIKEELKNIIDGFSSTTLFNVAVFEHHSTVLLFPRMMPATRENKAKVGKWLDPLNKSGEGTKTEDFGLKTLGPGGTTINDDFDGWGLKPVQWAGSARHWYTPIGVAIKEQADTVFVLTGWWGTQQYLKGEVKWPEEKRKKWEELYQKAIKLLAEENKERKARGEDPKVLRDPGAYIGEYFPEKYASVVWTDPPLYLYTPKDFAKSIHEMQKEYASKSHAKSGLSKKKKKLSVNMIFFASKDNIAAQEPEINNFRQIANLCNGDFRVLAGLEAIKNSASGK